MPMIVIASPSARTRWMIASHQPANTNQMMLPKTLSTPASGRDPLSWLNGRKVQGALRNAEKHHGMPLLVIAIFSAAMTPAPDAQRPQRTAHRRIGRQRARDR